VADAPEGSVSGDSSSPMVARIAGGSLSNSNAQARAYVLTRIGLYARLMFFITLLSTTVTLRAR
jgi:hypothetical protein